MKKSLIGKCFSKFGILIYFCINKVEVMVFCCVVILNYFWYVIFMYRIIYFLNFLDVVIISFICKLLLFSMVRI